MNAGQTKTTDVHLARIASSNEVTSWMSGKFLQAIDPGSWRSDFASL